MLKNMNKNLSYFIYILECKDGSLYTGITKDVEKRLREHNTSPKGAKYTQQNLIQKLK